MTYRNTGKLLRKQFVCVNDVCIYQHYGVYQCLIITLHTLFHYRQD
nr:MAG TPA: Carbamoyl phosphate synthetase [Bacteriophage sp.]DAY32723.1 MAG TPA: Carbamoyl phosphate synthetase [Caudoviricetes sp.]